MLRSSVVFLCKSIFCSVGNVMLKTGPSRSRFRSGSSQRYVNTQSQNKHERNELQYLATHRLLFNYSFPFWDNRDESWFGERVVRQEVNPSAHIVSQRLSSRSQTGKRCHLRCQTLRSAGSRKQNQVRPGL